MRWAMMLVLLLGCPPADDGGTTDDEQTTTGGEGETEVIVERVDEDEEEDRLSDSPPEPSAAECTTSADCPEGQQCYGEAGCDITWTCQDPRPCTRDLVTYCSCNGETVQGSGSCPPEPYAQRGACSE